MSKGFLVATRDWVQSKLDVLNRNMEYHVGDTVTFNQMALTGHSTASGAGIGGLNIQLGKNIGVDVTSVTVTGKITNVRANGTDISISAVTNGTISGIIFKNNLVSFGVNVSGLTKLEVYAVIFANLTITFA